MIEELTARVAAEDARIAELERQLGRNSRNSSQPPSTDGPTVSPSRAQRRRSAGLREHPDALLRVHLGYADLGVDDRLVWAFRAELPLPATTLTAAVQTRLLPVRPRRPAAVAEDAFDSGPDRPAAAACT